MAHVKTAVHRLLAVPTGLLILLTLLSAAGLLWVFLGGHKTHPLAYALYPLSFYTLCALIFRSPGWIRQSRSLLHRSRRLHRYLTQAELRSQAGLHIGAGINLIYALLKLTAGLPVRSPWLLAQGGYYLLAGSVYGFLIRRYRKDRGLPRNDALRQQGWRTYRTCGWLLLLLNLTMTGVVFQMIWRGQGNTAQGVLIYVNATYTFYRLTMLVIHTTKMKRSDDPIFSAAHSVDVCMALMSILTLQTAMFAVFGAEMPPHTQRLMNSLTGGVVCFAVLCTAIFMIRYPQRELGERPHRRTPHEP